MSLNAKNLAAKVVGLTIKTSENGKPYGVVQLQSSRKNKTTIDGVNHENWVNSTWFAIAQEKAIKSAFTEEIVRELDACEKFESGTAKGGFLINFDASFEMVAKKDAAGKTVGNQISMKIWDWRPFEKQSFGGATHTTEETAEYKGFTLEEPDFS